MRPFSLGHCFCTYRRPRKSRGLRRHLSTEFDEGFPYRRNRSGVLDHRLGWTPALPPIGPAREACEMGRSRPIRRHRIDLESPVSLDERRRPARPSLPPFHRDGAPAGDASKISDRPPTPGGVVSHTSTLRLPPSLPMRDFDPRTERIFQRSAPLRNRARIRERAYVVATTRRPRTFRRNCGDRLSGDTANGPA